MTLELTTVLGPALECVDSPGSLPIRRNVVGVEIERDPDPAGREFDGAIRFDGASDASAKPIEIPGLHDGSSGRGDR